MSKKLDITIAGPVGLLEAVLEEGELGKLFSGCAYAALVCHPHPLYGGTMDNKVVSTLVRTYRELGISVLRFNFRGVGASEGSHDEAVGEVDDLCAACEWMLARYPGSQLLLAGFSFGSAVAAAASERLAVVHMVLVAPPVMRYDYAPLGRFSCPTVLVLGGRDDVVDVASAQSWLAALDTPVRSILIPEATHFFHGQLVGLREQLSEVLNENLVSGASVD